MTQTYKIRVENVSKIFGRDPKAALAQVQAGMGKDELLRQSDHVLGLHDINLNIRAGETFVIMGLSGSGKSTLIRHFNRLIEPTSGRILVDGVDVLTLNDHDLRAFRRKKISMVFQKFALLPHKTVMENVIYGLLVDGMAPALAREKGADQIRLMDEPFPALDPLIRHDMQMQLRDIQARLHKTIVFITHDLDEALLLGDHIAILKDGVLRQVGTGPEILMAPADDYVARFVRDVNRARSVTCGALAVAGQPQGDLVLDASQPVEAAFSALAASDLPIGVRDGNGQIAGVLTRATVFRARAGAWRVADGGVGSTNPAFQ